MLSEALMTLFDTGAKAKASEVITLHKRPDKAWINTNGDLIEVEIPPDPRQHTVQSLDDLLRFHAGCIDPVIWHNTTSCTLVCNDKTRRDSVRLPLCQSRELLALLEYTGHAHDQKTLVRGLREGLGVDPAVVAQFRKLNWRSDSLGSGEVTATKDRMGKAISSEVSGVAELPEELTVMIPLYSTIGERHRYDIRLLLEYDTTNQLIRVATAPDAIDVALIAHQLDIATRLRDWLGDDAKIYFGTP